MQKEEVEDWERLRRLKASFEQEVEELERELPAVLDDDLKAAYRRDLEHGHAMLEKLSKIVPD